jgi:hypothetical protein
VIKVSSRQLMKGLCDDDAERAARREQKCGLHLESG